MTPPVVVTIAGSDSSGGAGIQADLKTFAANGTYGGCVITAVTAQDSKGVREVLEVPTPMVAAQLATVLDDLPVSAVKIGLVPSFDVAAVLIARAQAGELPNLVLDPVLFSSSGHRLGQPRAVGALVPYTRVVTPNLDELAALVGWHPVTGREVAQAAGQLAERGPECVVVTGGDTGAPEDDAMDLVWTRTRVRLLRAARVNTANTHGTGCTFSAAIAARLAWRDPLWDALLRAKEYVSQALLGSAGWRLGDGHGPLDHLLFGK